MKPIVYSCLLFCILTVSAHSGILEVGPSGTYSTLQAAAAAAQPGDTILFLAGTHTGNSHIYNLQGEPDAWITILAESPGNTIIEGGGTAWQFSDPAYLRISGFVFQQQTTNGVNIDDAGTYDTPAHHILLENCQWRAMNASGNNDQLKLSGIDSFTVRNCTFIDGSEGGSCIDMVGCHSGSIENNTFTNAGSNSIQAKGGTSRITIQRNIFQNGGARGINIGGSTGLQFFRPQDANYEAAYIGVYTNIFVGGTAAFAYVGAVYCEAINNTIVLPEKWVFRILQETTEDGFLACGNNRFANNIVYIDAQAASPAINIGANTAPETFQFFSNLWYHSENTSWNGPNLPATELDGILNRDPLFRDAVNGDYFIGTNSPAIGAGTNVLYPTHDFDMHAYQQSRSIGAYEGDRSTTGIPSLAESTAIHCTIAPHPVQHAGTITLSTQNPEYAHITLTNIAGQCIQEIFEGDTETELSLPLRLPPGTGSGIYFLHIERQKESSCLPFVVIR